jgi:hypothetical protein
MPSNTVTCLYCPWSARTNRFPDHVINKHPEKIHLIPKEYTHYIHAYIHHEGKTIEFCACLTCKKGTPHVPHYRHGARWAGIHAKNTECETNHTAMLEEFKKICILDAPAPVTIIEPPQLKPTKKPEADTSERKTMRDMSVQTTTSTREMSVQTSPSSRDMAVQTTMAEDELESDEVGYVYCLSNESMPGIFKVGMTRRTPDARIAELYNTSVSVPFVIEFSRRVTNPTAKERLIHRLLSVDRVNSKREFFKTPRDTIRDIFELLD